MIWVAWRQHRLQLLTGALLLMLTGAFLLATGPGIFSAFRNTGLAHCLALRTSDCGDLADAFLNRYGSLQFVVALFLVLPALGGLFWGAPLIAREVEQGTHGLAWTQGVTRGRWFGAKLALLGASAAAGAAILTWGLSWWSRPLVAAGDQRFTPGIFDIRGIVPIAYALFAVALGVAAGALIRRTVAAMAVAFAGFGAVRLAVDLWLRRHYMAPRVISSTFFGPSPRSGSGDWVLSTKTVDAAGRLLGAGRGIDLNLVAPRCPALQPGSGQFPGKDVILGCLQRVGARVVSVYQPGNRYWAFQWIETGIFVLLAAGLIAVSFWWVRRRVS